MGRVAWGDHRSQKRGGIEGKGSRGNEVIDGPLSDLQGDVNSTAFVCVVVRPGSFARIVAFLHVLALSRP